jgi:excisionase family DNA binding protein
MSEAKAAPQLHSIESAGKRLNVGRSTVFALMASGQLRSIKIGKRRLISESALIDFVHAAEAATCSD